MNAMNNKFYTGILAVAVIFLGIIALRPVPAVQKAVQTFGANAGEITYWISGEFSDDLTVTDNLTVGGDVAVTGALSADVPNTEVITMTSATTTPCAVANTSGATRTIVAIGVTETGTAASAGKITVKAGTSTSAYGTTHATKFLNTTVTKIASRDVISTTSTMMGSSGAYAPWRNGEYVVFSSGTTTHSGSCRILYY